MRKSYFGTWLDGDPFSCSGLEDPKKHRASDLSFFNDNVDCGFGDPEPRLCLWVWLVCKRANLYHVVLITRS